MKILEREKTTILKTKQMYSLIWAAWNTDQGRCVSWQREAGRTRETGASLGLAYEPVVGSCLVQMRFWGPLRPLTTWGSQINLRFHSRIISRCPADLKMKVVGFQSFAH